MEVAFLSFDRRDLLFFAEEFDASSRCASFADDSRGAGIVLMLVVATCDFFSSAAGSGTLISPLLAADDGPFVFEGTTCSGFDGGGWVPFLGTC